MFKQLFVPLLGLLLTAFASAGPQNPAAPATTQDKTALDLFSFDEIYTASGQFRDHSLGHQDSLETNFSYGHRFPIVGKWFLRAGVQYDRYDFSASSAPVPSHLQALSGDIAIEYVEQGFAGASLEIHPGVYFENEISSANFDIPVDLYATFKINDKFFVVAGAYFAMKEDPQIIPIGGVIWLITEKLRLEGTFPRAALVYAQSDDWEFRLTGDVDGGGYTIDHDSPLPERLRGATLQYYYQRIGAQATWSHWKPFDVTLAAGYVLERTFDYFRAGDVYRTNGAPFIKVSLGAQF